MSLSQKHREAPAGPKRQRRLPNGHCPARPLGSESSGVHGGQKDTRECSERGSSNRDQDEDDNNQSSTPYRRNHSNRRGCRGHGGGHRKRRNGGSDNDEQQQQQQASRTTRVAQGSSSATMSRTVSDDDSLFPHKFSLRPETPLNTKTLSWQYRPDRFVPVQKEQALRKILVPFKERERGMLCYQPQWRIQKLRKCCRKLQVDVRQATSLRRHFIKEYNLDKSMTQLGLGASADIRESARLFEVAVTNYLHSQDVSFWNEPELRAHWNQELKQNDDMIRAAPTPDFVLKEPVRLSNDGTLLYWLEAKMFFGASSVDATSGRSAIGNLVGTARKYTHVYGTGAMIFMLGCGDELAQALAQCGVIVLECTDNTVDLQAVEAHQRSWCADQDGNILP